MTGLRFSRRLGEQVPDATYAGAIYRFGRHKTQRARDVAFGFAMAFVVAVVIYAGLKGWIFGAMQ